MKDIDSGGPYKNISQLIEDVVNRLTEEEKKSFEIEENGKKLNVEKRIMMRYGNLRLRENLLMPRYWMMEILDDYRGNGNKGEFLDRLSIFFEDNSGGWRVNFDPILKDSPWWARLMLLAIFLFADFLRRKRGKTVERMGKKFSKGA